MGEVWLAEQTEPVRRQVALKLIKPGMDSRQVIRRFEAERYLLESFDALEPRRDEESNRWASVLVNLARLSRIRGDTAAAAAAAERYDAMSPAKQD